jgi:hypothetical protein
VSWLAGKMKKERTTVYVWMEKVDLSLDTLINIGKHNNYDFAQDIPELNEFVAESQTQYGITLKDCLERERKWHTKYSDLLEKFNELKDSIRG